jgi:uncharacterized protein YjbI with pentapeptide repeats
LHLANFSNAYLREANLTGADLSEAVLLKANMKDAVLTGTKFCKTIMPDGAVNNSGC